MSASHFRAADNLDNKKHLLLCASGSVATIKIPLILQALSNYENLSICVILTKSAISFLSSNTPGNSSVEHILGIRNVNRIFHDNSEWEHPWQPENGVLHIELRRWAHLMVIAPLSANTLAKIVGGLADNLMTSVIRAWDTTGKIDGGDSCKRIIVAPAMNTAMWNHPITAKQIKVLEIEWGIVDGNSTTNEGTTHGWFEVLRPMEKILACGDVGIGAMRSWEEIVVIIEQRLGL
ncbi:BgTH12-03113 [Blumeria graminis f. sp. triticale]|uniref:BgTH12-03113 n=1 Tax=Blumeria graminis f. sp. triticale TaxID=1689686 RepID=A0A9W4D3J4_BLUGR|nr:BgTH12-03113 [Blumeria graminis f. sp. triticale]